MHEDFKSLIADDAGVSALVSGRVTWGLHPQGTDSPAIVLHEISAVPQYTMAGQDGLVPVRVQVDCRGLTLASALAVARAVRTLLSGYRGTKGATVFSGVFQSGGRSGSEDTGPELFHTVSTDFEVWSHPAS